MTSLPIAPPTARAGTALKSSSPPPGAAGGDFAALLDDTTARTAHAEGPKTRPQDPRRDAASRQDDDTLRSDAANRGQTPFRSDGADRGQTPSSEAGAAVPQQSAPQDPQAAAAPPAPSADPAAAAAAAAAQAALTAQAAPVVPTGAPQGAPGQPALGPDGLPAEPKALLAATTDGQAAVDPGAQPADGAQGKLQIPAELLNAKGDGQARDHGKGAKGGAARELPPAPTLPPTADAATAPAPPPPSTPAAQAAPQADAAAPQAAPPTVAQGQPTATPQTVVATAPGAPQITRASVVQTAERVQELVRIATTRSGNARATLQLRPESLGPVDVHLRTTREGLVATIAAHDQAGLDALQHAGGELRRQLEDRGVQLHSLDLQLGAGAEGFSNQGDARQAGSGRSGAASSYDLDGDEDAAVEDLTITTAPSTSTSSLVDVTA